MSTLIRFPGLDEFDGLVQSASSLSGNGNGNVCVSYVDTFGYLRGSCLVDRCSRQTGCITNEPLSEGVSDCDIPRKRLSCPHGKNVTSSGLLPSAAPDWPNGSFKARIWAVFTALQMKSSRHNLSRLSSWRRDTYRARKFYHQAVYEQISGSFHHWASVPRM